MKTKAVQIGIGSIALFVLIAWLGGRLASGPTSALASMPSTEAYQGNQAQTAPEEPACDPNWDLVSSPNASEHGNYLRGIAAVSATDAWAVGYYFNGAGVSQTLVEHWNGSQWSVVPSPNVGTSSNSLLGVAAESSADVWAVGYYRNGSNLDQTLVEHWNGSQWSVISSPNHGTTDNSYLYGVAAVSSTDVWAAGNYFNGAGVSQTLLEHWDGSAWSIATSPNAGTSHNYLNGIAAVSSTDVWAVGYYINGSNVDQTLVEQWNGSQWSVASSPNVGTNSNVLNGVSAVSSTDVWAVGYYINGSAYQTLVEHWNGSQWSVVPSLSTYSYLFGVAAVSATDVWAVGVSGYQALAEHWDGNQWSVVPSPNAGTSDNVLYGVAAVSSTDVWAVGFYTTSADVNTRQTLVDHWNGSQWSVVPSPNGGTTDNSYLYGVAPVSATDVWAVGRFINGAGVWQTLVEHWNGSAWSIAISSNQGTSYNNYLSGVAAVSSTDVWAVGYYLNGTVNQTLVEHWDGGQWNVVSAPTSAQATTTSME